jgi:hypothetical protein
MSYIPRTKNEDPIHVPLNDGTLTTLASSEVMGSVMFLIFRVGSSRSKTASALDRPVARLAAAVFVSTRKCDVALCGEETCFDQRAAFLSSSRVTCVERGGHLIAQRSNLR